MATRKATLIACDNPDCSTEYVLDPDDVPPMGFYFDKGSAHFGGGGGTLPKTYACDEACIVPAITARINEVWHGR